MQQGTPTKRAAKADIYITPVREAWDELRKATGLTSDSALAEKLGVTRMTTYRVLTYTVKPSADFIARTLAAFPHAGFERLFKVAGR